MFQIQGYSRFLDLKGSIRLYYVLGFGIFISILSFILYKDIIITLTMIMCTAIGYFLLSIPPKHIDISLDEEHLKIDEIHLLWEQCLEWAVVDLNGVLEFVIRTNKLNHQFYYFYLDSEEANTKEFISILSSYLGYNPEIPALNPAHTLLRNWGLK